MTEAQLIGVFDIVSFIVGIASIVISIVAMVLSILFYCWSKRENESTTINITRIEEKISFLDKLFDQLYAKAFDAVKSHGDELHKMLRQTIGATSGANHKNYDLELYLQFAKPGSYSIDQIAKAIGLEKAPTLSMVQSAVKDPRYKDLGLVIDGDIITSSPKIADSSEDQS